MPTQFDNNGTGVPIPGFMQKYPQGSIANSYNAQTPQAPKTPTIYSQSGGALTATGGNQTIKPGTSYSIPGLINSNGTSGMVGTNKGVLPSTTSPAVKPVTAPPAQTEQQLHDAKVKAITDQISALQKQQKTQQEGLANGTMDANGNPIQIAGSTQTTSQIPTEQMKTDAQAMLDRQVGMDGNKSGVSYINGQPVNTPYTPTNTNLGTVASDEANVAKTTPTAPAQAGLMKTAQQSADEKAAADALMSKFQTASPEYQAATANANAYNEALKQSRINEAHGLTANSMNPISLDSMTGRSLVLQNQYGLEQSALGQAYNAATAQQGQANTQQANQQGAAEQAGSLANTQQATQQAGYNQAGNLANSQQQTTQQGLGQVAGLLQPTQVSPGNALVNPITGQEQYSGLGGLTGLGKAQQNIKQGQDYQQQAADLSNSLTTLKITGSNVIQLMKGSGLNFTDSPVVNAVLIQYMKNQNPSAYNSFEAGIGEIKNYASAIISSQTGLTPTEVSATVNAYPFENLSPTQLQEFLQNLDSYGQIRLAGLQQSSDASYASNGATKIPGYMGTNASPSSNLGTGTTVNPITAGAGTAVQGAEDLIGGVIKGLTGQATNAVVGGAAAMFGA